MTLEALKYMKWGFVLLFFNINLGRWDLLPNFLGVILLIHGVRSLEMTETLKRLQPLLWALALDHFLHWLFTFNNELDNLAFTVISLYAIYLLLGEIAQLIREKQPHLALRLEKIRIVYAVLQVLHYLFGAYNLSMVAAGLALGFVVLLVMLLVVLFRIEPAE